MAIPNEQRLIELLTEYIARADQYFERADRMEEQFAQHIEKMDKQLLTNQMLLKHSETFDKQSERLDTLIQTLIKHSESIEKIETKLFDHNDRLTSLKQNND